MKNYHQSSRFQSSSSREIRIGTGANHYSSIGIVDDYMSSKISSFSLIDKHLCHFLSVGEQLHPLTHSRPGSDGGLRLLASECSITLRELRFTRRLAYHLL